MKLPRPGPSRGTEALGHVNTKKESVAVFATSAVMMEMMNAVVFLSPSPAKFQSRYYTNSTHTHTSARHTITMMLVANSKCAASMPERGSSRFGSTG